MRTKNYKLTFLFIVLVMTMFSCRKDPTPENTGLDYSDCLVKGTDNTLDIVTFNIKEYPKYGEETAEKVAELIKQMQVDIIALQEISSEEELNNLADRLIGWEPEFYPINNSIWNLAYLIRSAEVSVNDAESKVIYDDDFYSFPRPPFELHVTHIPSGKEVIILNNHFKCCGGSDNEDRRRSATDLLHNYVTTVYPDEPVIILGDLNDEINGTSYEDNVFWTIVDDPDNFMFTDMDIAMGSVAWWSYPSWPSHIDHICVSDELFSSIDTTAVYRPGECYEEYSDIISDHRPVMLRLK